MIAWLLLLSCRPAPDPGLTVAQVQGYVPSGTADREAWAGAVHQAIRAAGQPVDEDHVCQVLAVIEQESGYAPDPAVPGLAGIALRELEQSAAERLGRLGDDALELLLDVTPEGSEVSFRERLAKVRTERDLDRLYRDLVRHHEGRLWGLSTARAVLAPGLAERENPVTTAGSMQVAVAWALEHPAERGQSTDEVREALYTVPGGVHYGTKRLFDQDAPYREPIHRFADYNAGVWASRNAAFQERVADLSGEKLTLDGDLLVYNRRGRARRQQDGETVGALFAWVATGVPDLDNKRVRADLELEKSAKFEQTATWRAVQEAWSATHGEPRYARVPEVTLDSPKLAGTWTTATFAKRVQKRYDACRARR